MSTSSERHTVAGVSGLLGVLALAELILLRTGTRALIHIPGLGRFETPIRILAEVWRFAYYHGGRSRGGHVGNPGLPLLSTRRRSSNISTPPLPPTGFAFVAAATQHLQVAYGITTGSERVDVIGL